MNIQYYRSAWGDIKNSPGWFGKLCLLALLNFVPVFGQIVTFAYLYGWAREIAWGTHEPMPQKIFSNEDGKFWRRGWFLLVLTFVFALVPEIVSAIGASMQSMAYQHSGMGGYGPIDNPALYGVGNVVALVGFAGSILCMLLAWIGSMRIALYDRLSAGFQLSQIWKMLRHDVNGILKIFGMYLLVTLIVSVILGIIFTVLMFAALTAGLAGLMGAGYTVESLQHMTDAQAVRFFVQLISSAGVVGLVGLLVSTFLLSLASVYLDMLVARALGYWTMQFDVPHWTGQDDPLPFEVRQPSWTPGQQPPAYQQTAAYQQPMAYQQQYGVQQPMQAQPYYGEQPMQGQPYPGAQPGPDQQAYGGEAPAAQPFAGPPAYGQDPLQPDAQWQDGVQLPDDQVESGAFDADGQVGQADDTVIDGTFPEER